MKILWISGNPSMYNTHKKGYNNGGWIASLEAVLSKHVEVELGVCFFYDDNIFKTKIGDTTYYPINLYNTKIKKILHNLFYERYDNLEMEKIRQVIGDFKPDVIHIWGTELSFGLIKLHTSIPVVIHVQGLLGPVYNAFFTPSVNKASFVLNFGNGILKILKNLQVLRNWSHNVNREKVIISNNTHFLGRTHWDKSIINFLNPNAKYFVSNELLRPEFYTAPIYNVKTDRKKIILITTISQTLYKGYDLILKTANILKSKQVDFEWKVIGLSSFTFIEKIFNLKSKNINIVLKGVIGVDELIKELIESDIYVHSSYIDNSPNSVCEAQILGLPVVSTNVGGISTLIEDNYSGVLVPANDPYYLAAKLIDLFYDFNKRTLLSINAKQNALERHNSKYIIENLINLYSEVKR